MELKLINEKELVNLRDKHAVVIVSDGKMKIVELPSHGNIEIFCHDKKVKQVKEINATNF